jgi:hypothetical protein
MKGRHRRGGLGSTRQRATVLLAPLNIPGGAGLSSAADVCSLALGARSAGRTGVAV